MDMPPTKTKKELQSFLGILKCLGKFSPVSAEVCEPLHKLTSVKADLTWNKTYWDTHEKAKNNKNSMSKNKNSMSKEIHA